MCCRRKKQGTQAAAKDPSWSDWHPEIPNHCGLIIEFLKKYFEIFLKIWLLNSWGILHLQVWLSRKMLLKVSGFQLGTASDQTGCCGGCRNGYGVLRLRNGAATSSNQIQIMLNHPHLNHLSWIMIYHHLYTRIYHISLWCRSIFLCVTHSPSP